MILELLRERKVDLLAYLPEFLAADERFKGTGDTLSNEHERIRLDIADIVKQIFVETATWGLEDWEKVYGLKHNEEDTYLQRREQLKIKIKGANTVTRDNLNQMVNTVAPGKDAEIVENVAPNVFRVDIGTAAALEEIRKVIDIYKPAHLTYILSHNMKADEIFYIGGVVSEYTKINVEMAEEINIQTDGMTQIGGVVSVLHIYEIGGI